VIEESHAQCMDVYMCILYVAKVHPLQEQAIPVSTLHQIVLPVSFFGASQGDTHRRHLSVTLKDTPT